MTDAPFRPFDTYLDEARALAILREATKGADDGELFLERRRSEAIVLDDGRIKTASYDASEGFGLRAVRGEVAGYAHSTEISESAIKRASATARLAVGDGGGSNNASGPTGSLGGGTLGSGATQLRILNLKSPRVRSPSRSASSVPALRGSSPRCS